jgi:hypothetical protein
MKKKCILVTCFPYKIYENVTYVLTEDEKVKFFVYVIKYTPFFIISDLTKTFPFFCY